jgi:hypothetical protein
MHNQLRPFPVSPYQLISLLSTSPHGEGSVSGYKTVVGPLFPQSRFAKVRRGDVATIHLDKHSKQGYTRGE